MSTGNLVNHVSRSRGWRSGHRHERLQRHLEHLTRHPLLLGMSVLGIIVLTHIGTLDVTGIYYALLETSAKVTHEYHHLFPNKLQRNEGRDVFEGFFGATLAAVAAFNWFKARWYKGHGLSWKIGARLDQFRSWTHIIPPSPRTLGGRKMTKLETAFAFPLYVGLAIPGFLLGAYIVNHLSGIGLHHVGTILQANGVTRAPAYDRAETVTWGSKFGNKIIGLIAGVLPRFAMPGTYACAQRRFVDHRVKMGKTVPFPLWLPQMRGLFWKRLASGEVEVFPQDAPLLSVSRLGMMLWPPLWTHRHRSRMAIALVLLPLAGFAGLGWYVLTYIA